MADVGGLDSVREPALGTDLMSFLAEFWAFMRARKKLWLAPALIVLVLLGGVVILSEGSAIAPFIYTMF
jgi:hypothetical protein